jgi:protoporphyrinogen/coproporphyrinogen III oxidase
VIVDFQPGLTRCHPERSEGSRLVRRLTRTAPIAPAYAATFSSCSHVSVANSPPLTPFPVYPEPLGALSFSSSRSFGPKLVLATRYSPLASIPFRIRSFEKSDRNPFGMRNFKTQGLKSFRIRSFKKRGRGELGAKGGYRHRSIPTSTFANLPPRTTLDFRRCHEFKMIGWLTVAVCSGAAYRAPSRQPSDQMTTQVPVLIVGAGISGLACAYYLRKSGIDAQIVESSPRPGGVIRSERRDGFLLELGPQSFSGTPQLLALCRDLHIENELVEAPHSAPRFLLINGQLKPAPLSPPAFFASSLFSAKTKWSILRDALGHSAPPYVDESVADFTLRKFSAELLDKLVGPFVSGIYAGDPEKLSLRAAFPQLHEAERSAGSVIRGMIRAAKSKPGSKQRPTLQSFKNGNETLIQALTANLGPALRCGVEVTTIQQGGAGFPQLAKAESAEPFVVDVKTTSGVETIAADRLVLALPTYITAKLLHRENTTPIEEIEYAPLAVVSLGYRRQDVGHSLNGFGFLIPRSENLRTLGAVWNSSLFPNRAPEGLVLLTSFIGGATDPQAVELSTKEIVSTVHRELAPILSIRSQPTFCNVEIYQRALPQYNIGHTERIATLERESSSLLNLKLVGNYLRGPAIGVCIERAFAVADEIRAGFSGVNSG